MIINSSVPLLNVFEELPKSYLGSKVTKVALEALGTLLLIASGGIYLCSHAIPVVPCALALIVLIASRCLKPSIKINEMFKMEDYTHLNGKLEPTEVISIENTDIQVANSMVRDIRRKFVKLTINGEEVKIEGEAEELAATVVKKLYLATGNVQKTAQLTHFLNQNLNHIVKGKHFAMFEEKNLGKLRFKQNMHPPFAADRLEEVRVVMNKNEETIFARARYGVIDDDQVMPGIEIGTEVLYDFLKSEVTYTVK